METPATDDETTAPPEPERVLLHMPVDVRSLSLVVIATLLSVFALHWARAVFVPVLMGLLFSYALAPLVDRLVRWHLPRWLAAAALLLGIAGSLGGGAYLLSDQADNLIQALPEAAQKLRQMIREAAPGRSESSLDKVQKAAAQLERAAAESGAVAATKGVARVQIERPAINIKDYLFTGTLRLAEIAGQVVVVAFVTYFLLAAGDSFRRKLVRIAGPTMGKRRLTLQALNEITEQVRRYLLVQLLTSVVVGLATGLAFWGLGLGNASAWGVLAAALNLIPYIGAALLTGAAALVALLQFGQVQMALLIGAVSIGLHMLSGYALTPWLTSRMSRLNTVVVFVGLLAWGWLWGVWGLLLGTPILMAVKAVCDRIDSLKPIGEMMGGTEP
ncbi:MAG: AI-2E family transporter [Burkholderiaceae bacterium]